MIPNCQNIIYITLCDLFPKCAGVCCIIVDCTNMAEMDDLGTDFSLLEVGTNSEVEVVPCTEKLSDLPLTTVCYSPQYFWCV